MDKLVRDAKRSLEELTTQQRENIALLKEKLDLNERQVRAALGILGENAPRSISAAGGPVLSLPHFQPATEEARKSLGRPESF